jgi:Na+/proline symporter
MMRFCTACTSCGLFLSSPGWAYWFHVAGMMPPTAPDLGSGFQFVPLLVSMELIPASALLTAFGSAPALPP